MTVQVKNFGIYDYITVTATTTSANSTFASTTNNDGVRDLLIYNMGTARVYVNWGRKASQTATSTTAIPVGAGRERILNVGEMDNFGILAAVGTADVFLARGAGIFGGG